MGERAAASAGPLTTPALTDISLMVPPVPVHDARLNVAVFVTVYTLTGK